MGEAFVPIGTQLQIGDKHSAETFTAVAEVNQISGLGWSRNMVETTTLDTTGGYRTYLPTFRDGEVITVDMNFTATGWSSFKDLFDAEEEETDSMDYRLVLKAGATTKYTWEFNAFVQSIKLGNVDFNNKVSAQVMLKVTGAATETAA